PLPPHGPAPSGVSQVDPSPLVEPVEVSSNTSGPAEGGDPTPAATVTPRRSARFAVPPGFPPRQSSMPLQPVAVESGAAGGGTTGGAGSGGAECPLGTGGTGGTGACGPGTSRKEAFSSERLREWAVQWSSPSGGASHLRAVGAGTAGAGGADTAGAGGSATGGTGVASAGGTGTCRQETLSLERLREWAVQTPGATGGTGGAVAVGAATGSPGSRRQESLSPELLREWAVQWGSPGGGASRLRAGGAGNTGAGGAGTTGAGGSATVGTGARRQETLSPERLREWPVQWGSPGGGASRARTTRAEGTGTPGAARGAAAVGAAAGSPGGGAGRTGAAGSGGAGLGGASAGVPGTGDAGAARGTGGAGTAGGTGGAGLGGASTGDPGVGRAGGTGTGGGADTGGTTGGPGVIGASRQELLSPLHLREWAVYWGSPGGGAGGTDSGAAAAIGAGGSRGATTQPRPSALRHLLSLPPAATEFPVAGTTPPLLFPPTDQSQPQLQPYSPLPTPAPHTEVTTSLTAHRQPETRASTLERPEPETRASVPARVRPVRCPRAPAVPGTHDMTLRPSSVPPRIVLPSPPVSSLPHVPDPESELVRAASLTLVDFAALCRLDYAVSLVFYSSFPPSVGVELALGCDVLEDRQFELECCAGAAPHLASTLLCPEGDPDALDIPTPRTSAKAITGTYVDEFPPPGANMVDGMWIFR
ncbi:unnamed protein product, partial [Closterium sp. NIES-53]